MKALRNLCRTSAQQGFTLLEVLLSLALTGLLLGMLSAGVYAVVNDWQRESSVLDTTLDKALAVLQLERALQAAFPHSYIDPERLQRMIYIRGAEDSLSFVSTVSPQRQAGLTTWRLQPDADGDLQLSLTPAYGDDPDLRLVDSASTPILPGYRATFRYLLQRSPEEKEWLTDWEGPRMQSLPQAVHVLFEPLDRNSDAPALEFIAPIRAMRHVDIEATIPVLP